MNGFRHGELAATTATAAFVVDFDGGGEVAGVLPYPSEGNGAGGGGRDGGLSPVAVITIGEDRSEKAKIAFVVGTVEESDESGAILVGFADFVSEPVARAGGFDGEGSVPGSGEGSKFNHGSKVAWPGEVARKKIIYFLIPRSNTYTSIFIRSGEKVAFVYLIW